MSGSHTVEIKVYSQDEKLAIVLPHPSTCRQAKVAIAKKLGMKSQSASMFGLCIGPQGRPSKILKDIDVLPVGGDFSLERFIFDLEKEVKLSKQDEEAMHLLFCEAKHHFLQENSKITPSPSQREELESYIDPDFPVERQFLDLVRTAPGYDRYIVHECNVKDTITTNKGVLPEGAKIECHLTMNQFIFMDPSNGEILLEWDWRAVKRWKAESSSGIGFEVCLEDLNASILRWIAIESRQSNYLFNVASGICDIVKAKQDKVASLSSAGVLARVQDPLGEFVNGLFKGFTPNFDSIAS